ncbi:MAG: DnaA regulatory inactivator Hda [Methylococcaceae bacterium]
MSEQFPLHFEFRANQTFDDFFAGANEPIIEDLKRCVLGNGEQQIFVWGKSGQGKSHLLQACCHSAQQHQRQSFYFDLARYSRHQPAILMGLDDYDVVCVDNMDWIIGQENWELALCEFMQRHFECGHQLIISATGLPNYMTIKTPDLKTHLSWGLTFQLKTLVNTHSIDALIFKADAMGFEISPQVGRFLMIQHQTELEGLWHLLEKIDRASLAAKRKLTVPFLKRLFNVDV